jgi:hypothetical protein
MMKDWETLYNALPDEELDKIALLRVMECTNGIIQYAHRDNASYKLPIEETRRAMKFSMSSIKNMAIPLKNETVTFAPETEELMREARDLYSKGVKFGDDDAYAEFMKISAASAKACGFKRLMKAKDILAENIDDIPSETLIWGVEYLNQFLG